MNNKGQKSVLGFGLIAVGFVLVIALFAILEPSKEFLDTARSSSSLNCRGTDNFNQTAFTNDNNNTLAKLTRRPTCFVTGLEIVYFFGAFLIGITVWIVNNWRKIK